MSPSELLTIAVPAGAAIGGAITFSAKIVVAALRELLQGQKEQTQAQNGIVGAIHDMKIELTALRTRVDTLIEVSVRTSDPMIESSQIRGPYPLRQKA